MRHTLLVRAPAVVTVLVAATLGCGGAGQAGAGGGAATGSTSSAGGGAASGTGGGATSSSGTGGAEIDPQAPCPPGSQLSTQNADAGFAEFGSVFSSTPYQRDVVDSIHPQALDIQVQNAGAPVVGCEVRWATDAGHGWVFPAGKVTGNDGHIRAIWTAGDQGSEVATAKIKVDGVADQAVTFTGKATPDPQTRTDSVHITYDVPGVYSEFKVQVTPVTGPASTYYSTHNWAGAYGGIQFDDYNGEKTTKVLFSVWDVDPNQKSEIKDKGLCNEVVGFGGEGTGTSCRLLFPPSKHGAIAGLPDDYMMKPGDTYETHMTVTYPADCATCADYAFSFTDVTRGLGPISLGTQRYKEKAMTDYAIGFIEDWSDQPGDTCLNAGTRTAYFHDIQALTGGGWKKITGATFDAVFAPGNHEICTNYFFGVEGGRFLMSSGGSKLISRPVVPGDPDFGDNPKASF
ncbi:MAG: DUF3472 domain-containing protein [Byssovorax sp.]